MDIAGILDAAEKLCLETGRRQFVLTASSAVMDGVASGFRPIQAGDTWGVPSSLNTEVGTIRLVVDEFMPPEQVLLTVDDNV